jgi:tyrosyl-tRNA synthetase
LSNLKNDLAEGKKHPRQVKEDLAKEIVTRYHSAAAAEHEAREFIRVLREKEVPEDIEEIIIKKGDIPTIRFQTLPAEKGIDIDLPYLLVTTGTAATTSEARRLINQGGVQVDGEKVTEMKIKLSPAELRILKVGKRRFKKVMLSD